MASKVLVSPFGSWSILLPHNRSSGITHLLVPPPCLVSLFSRLSTLPSLLLTVAVPISDACLAPCSSPNSSNNACSIQQFLQKSCGLSQNQAIAASNPLIRLKSIENPEQVLRFFKHCGFSDAHIIKLVVRRPTVLASSVQKTLQPKVRVLERLGIVGGQLGFLVSRDSALLATSLEKKILPGISFLQKLLRSDDNVVSVIIRVPRLLQSDIERKFKPNFLFLQNHGFDDRLFCYFFMKKPSFLMSAETLIKNAVKTVERLGILPQSKMFPHALFIVSSLANSTLEHKIKFFISLGLSEEEVIMAFRKSPYILAISEKNVQTHMDFLVNILNCEPSIVVRYPRFLLTSMEAKVIPRYRVFRKLQSMQLPRKSFNVLDMFCTSEKVFLQRFVFRYGESSGLYEIYKGINGAESCLDLDTKGGKCKEKESQKV